jgi:cyclopropane fatty-acyl-phospholipid synthase-like methyltransferase
LAGFVSRALRSRRIHRVRDDAQLKLYSRMLRREFLHYGYFDDTTVTGAEISIGAMERAQERYAERLLEFVIDRAAPVLDSGCGMGGLSRCLLDRGFQTVSLTPDANQIAYIRENLPGASLIHARFQDTDLAAHMNRFGTVIHSESLQYIPLDEACKMTRALLKPGGRWIISDYFRTGEAHEKSGHPWVKFQKAAAEHGFVVTHEEDITANVMPTLAFVHLLGQRIAIPVLEFLMRKIEVKASALHYVLEDLLKEWSAKAARELDVVNPVVFLRDKKYMLVVLTAP